MDRKRTARYVKRSLLALLTCYLLWYGALQLSNFGGHIPEYRMVPLSTNSELYEIARKVDSRLVGRVLVEERVEDGSRAQLEPTDERSIRWLIAKGFPVLPRKILRFTIRSSDTVEVSVKRVPFGKTRRCLAGKDSDGWFLYLGDHPDF
jgi:hypothetical protein